MAIALHNPKSKHHYYAPRGACKEIIECRDAEVLISGPAGTGKSRACLEKLHLMALLNPEMRGLIVRKTLTSLKDSALVTWKRDVINESLILGIVSEYGGSASEPPQFRYSNGSRILIGGMDKATRVMSAEYDVVYVNEATELTIDDWEAITSRLRSNKVSFQQIIGDCNPDAPTHWLKLRWDSGKLTNFVSVHEDNPLLVDNSGYVTEKGASYLAKLDALTGVRYLRLRKGIWAAAEGMIYDEWDPAVHLINSFEIPEDWPRYWSIDFGYRNPFVCQHWAENPDGELFLYREFYHTGLTNDQHAKRIMNVVAPKGIWIEPKPQAIICDHDAEGRATLERELGLNTRAAHKKVLEGIQAVQRRVREKRIHLIRGARILPDPSLIDAKKPTSTADEFPAYVWADKATKEEPRKEDDHGMDATRYLVAYRDLKGRARIDRFI